MKLIVFEDSMYEQLYPIALTRAVFELKCGITGLEEKIRQAVQPAETAYFVREYLKPTFAKKYPSSKVNELKNIASDDLTIVNGRCLMTSDTVLPEKEGWSEENDSLIFARAKKGTLAKFSGESIESLIEFVKKNTPKIELKLKVINYPWELINHNPELIADDFKRMKKTGIEGKMAPQSVVYGPTDRVYVAKGAEIHPFVCLDTNGGPVIIDEGAVIHPYTRIEGPTYIGKKTLVLGAKIREGCSIGPVCRVGGEVEESIMHAYSNKFHDGFLGHAYVGEWVNLGALTTNSDLKNDYSNVSVVIKGRLTDTGTVKAGCFIGDHTKTSIGTYLNTGAHVGALCILVGSGGVLPKYIPSGSWFIKGVVTKGFGFKKLIQTAKMVMSRRKVEFSQEDEALLTTVYEIAKSERDELIRKGSFE